MRSFPTALQNIDDQVDVALLKIARSSRLTLPPEELFEVDFMNENSYLLDHFMLEKGLIKVVKEGRTLTGKGLEISNFGGWTIYQRQLKRRSPGVAVFSESTLKYQLEIKSLRGDLEKVENELKIKAEREVSSAELIKTLIKQKAHQQMVSVLGGIALGFILTSLLWFFISGN